MDLRNADVDKFVQHFQDLVGMRVQCAGRMQIKESLEDN